MMVGFFAGIALLMGGALVLVSRVVRSVGLSAASYDRNTVHTPGGSYRLQKQDQVGPGLPLYPRASLELPDASSAGAAIKQAQNGVNVSTYHTSDMRDFVDNWYSQHLSPEFKRRDSGQQPVPDIFKDANVSDSDIAFVAERGDQMRIVTLSLDEGGTKISLIRVDKTPAATSSSPKE
jgi:hypothetical protein